MAVPASPRPSTSLSRTACAISALADVGKQRQLASPLHRQRQLLLVLAGEPGDAAGPGLAPVRDEPPQEVEVLVVDLLDVDPRVLSRPPTIGEAASPAAAGLGLLSLLSSHFMPPARREAVPAGSGTIATALVRGQLARTECRRPSPCPS